MHQRDKLYRAEETLGYGGFFPGVEYCQLYIDRKILKTKFWREHSDIQYIKACYPSFGMTGTRKIDDLHAEIDYGIARLCEHGTIHETTHLLGGVPLTVGTSPEDHEKDHGPIFAGALLAMYKRYIGKDTAYLLMKEFDRVGVKYKEYE